jgi:hypothetical protein
MGGRGVSPYPMAYPMAYPTGAQKTHLASHKVG